MYRPVPRALMMVFPTRAVPLKTPETVIDGWASLRGGIESKDLAPLAILSPEPSALLPELPVAAAIVPGFTRSAGRRSPRARGRQSRSCRVLGDSLRKVLDDPQPRTSRSSGCRSPRNTPT
jgi:hypothetical protein